MWPIVSTIAKTAWRARVSHFWLVWSALTVSAAAFFYRFVGAPTTLSKTKAVPLRRQAQTHRGAILGLFGLFLIFYAGSTLVGEDFTYYDNSMFTLQSLRHQNIDPPIWRGEGRFFPLGNQEFNVICHFTATATGYHVVPIFELFVLCCALILLDDEIDLAARAVLCCCVLVTPAVVVSFGQLIFTERNVMIFVALLALSVRKFEVHGHKTWAVAAAICAQFALYYKEVAFLIILGFSVSRIVMRSWQKHSSLWKDEPLQDQENRLDLCLLALSILFLFYYLVVMLPHPSMHYAEESRWTLTKVVLFQGRPLTVAVYPCLVREGFRNYPKERYAVTTLGWTRIRSVSLRPRLFLSPRVRGLLHGPG